VALGSSGAEVWLTARNRARLDDSAAWSGPGARVFPADLADPGAVTALAAEVHAALGGRPLAGIVHAAGIMSWSSPAAAEGWSLVPLVNAVSPWRLTLALEADLGVEAGARVAFVAGAPFTLQGLKPRLEGWRGDQPGRGLALALEAGAAKVALARVLHRRWAGRASAWAFHPGFVKSNLAEGLPVPLRTLGCLAQPFLATRCRTGEFLATDPGAPALSGALVSGRRAYPTCPLPPDPEAEDAWAAALA